MADEIIEVKRLVRSRLMEKETLLSAIKLKICNLLLPDRIMDANATDTREWLEKEIEADIEVLKGTLRGLG